MYEYFIDVHKAAKLKFLIYETQILIQLYNFILQNIIN